MHTDNTVKQDQMLSRSKKNANNKAWYKQKADSYDIGHSSTTYGYGDVSEMKRMKVNYDLFNNILNLKDFDYVCKPYGPGMGELPAQMVNRDISSGKIKAILGMEANRPFPWKALAVNAEATTRKEQEEFGRIREYVVSSIMTPIEQEIRLKKEQEAQGRELTKEEAQKIEQEVAEELKAATPQETKKYMTRDHQDPAEVLSHQLLEYLKQKEELQRKFNTAFKHGLLSGEQTMYVGIINGEPVAWNVDSMRVRGDKSPDTPFREDGEWVTCEYRMTPSAAISRFSKELTKADIRKIYDDQSAEASLVRMGRDLSFDNIDDEDQDDYANTIRVLHCVWKSLRKIGFLTYVDEVGEKQTKFVDEGYRYNGIGTDVDIEWHWIPEVYETWKIGTDIYVNMGPVPGQFKDLDNLYHCKLPYYGVTYDDMNSQTTSLMDRLKVYQYYYNIIMFKVELLMASDKGRKVMMNIKGIPKTNDFDLEKWQYLFESTPFMWFNPDEEGTTYNDINTMAKEIDLSLASDIGRYMELAAAIKQQAGESVGITDQVTGQIGAREAVSNTQQSLQQSAHILEPYFEMHTYFKKNVMQALIDTAKVAYTESKPAKLAYILDDFSKQIIDMDMDLLDNSTIGIFVSNTSNSAKAQDTIQQLAHAAMQNGKIELSEVLSLMRTEGLVESEEILKVAEENRRMFEMNQQKSSEKAEAEMAEKARQFKREEHEMEKEQIILKEEERRKTEVIKASFMGASFNPDVDINNNGENDFMELIDSEVEKTLKVNKDQREREQFEHQKAQDKKKNEQEDEKIKLAKNKKA